MNFPEYRFELMVRESHLDAFGHVNNAAYLIIAEDARWDMLRTEGYTFERVHELKQGPTILTMQIEFKKELRLGDPLTVVTQVQSYQRKIGVLAQTFYRAETEVTARIEMKFGLFDINSRRLILPTAEWAVALRLGR